MKWYTWTILILEVELCFLTRVVGQLDKIFIDGAILYRGIDSWYHMGIAERLYNNSTALPRPYELLGWIVSTVGHLGLDYKLVGAYLPPVLGALILIPLFFLGREILKNNWASLFSCLLAVILPTELFHRSLLGFTDTHVLEVLLLVTILLFVMIGVRKKSIIWLILAGLTTFLYLYNWRGGILVLGILGLWSLIELLKRLPERAIIPSLTLIAVASAIIMLSLDTTMLKEPLWGFGSLISETQPTTIDAAFDIYGLALPMALAGLFFLAKSKKNLLFLVWSIVAILMTISEKRWGYYAVVNISLLSGLFLIEIYRYAKPKVKTFSIALICLFTLMASINGTIGMAKVPNDLSREWYEALVWLKDNSPKPTPKDLYYILSWWDYGYWIEWISERLPIENPSSSRPNDGYNFYLSTTVEEANIHLRRNIKYIVVGRDLVEEKFLTLEETMKSNTRRENTLIYKLWTDQVPEYQPVYSSKEVKIFEVKK